MSFHASVMKIELQLFAIASVLVALMILPLRRKPTARELITAVILTVPLLIAAFKG